MGISSLDGLQYATNLTSVSLGDNVITDITPLLGLAALQDANVSYNQISGTVPSLAGLTSLTRLNLSGNQIDDVSGIAGAVTLESLWLNGNQITQAAPLAGLVNLIELDLSDNQIEDVSPMVGLTNLSYLGLAGNRISDVTPLVDNGGLQAGDELIVVYNVLDLTVGSPNATAVGALRARGVEVTTLPQNVPVVFVHPNLEAAVREQLGIPAPTPVTQVDMYFNLVTLDASNREIDDLTGLEYALSLYNLNLAGNRIDSIDPLETLGNLQTLDVSGNEIYNLGPLVRNAGIGSGDPVQVQLNYLDLVPGGLDMQDIETLQARGATVTSTPQKTLPSPVVYFADPNLEAAVRTQLVPPIPAVQSITQADMLTLATLDASNLGITDLGGLEYATNLTALNLDSNALANISPIASLTNLTELDLASNPISDFTPLSSLTNLTRLIVLDTGMTDASALTGLTGLTYLHLSDNRLSSIAPLGELDWAGLPAAREQPDQRHRPARRHDPTADDLSEHQPSS